MAYTQFPQPDTFLSAPSASAGAQGYAARIGAAPAGAWPRRRAGARAAAPALLAVAAGCMALAGCTSTPRQAYPETFKDTSTYSRSYAASDAATCEAARRALLSQGYTIGKAQTDGVEGQKNFQVQDENQQHQVISFHVVCASDHHASPKTTVFVNAVQDRYIIKKTSSSAGVGLSVLGSVSMPFGSSDDSLAKISSETISASSFYEGFFDLLQRYLPQSGPAGGAAPASSDASSPAAKMPTPAAAPAPSPPPSSQGAASGGTAPAAKPAAGQPQDTPSSAAPSSQPDASTPASPAAPASSPTPSSPPSSPPSSTSSSTPSSTPPPAPASAPSSGPATSGDGGAGGTTATP